MGLLDQILKGLIGKFLGGGAGTQNPLLDIALSLLTNPQTGGLGGLVDAFKNKGLGDLMGSWISTGENQPISGELMQKVLGSDQIKQFAQSLGISNEEVSSGLASLLPEIIDKLTPKGTVPESGSIDQELSTIKKMLSGR